MILPPAFVARACYTPIGVPGLKVRTIPVDEKFNV
jgi:hypothetical protein